MTQFNRVDDASIQAVIAAMGTALSQCASARSTVEGIRGSMQWTGDSGNIYRTNLDNWTAGLTDVERGLHTLQDAMGTHQKISTTTEDHTSQQSKWYTGG